MSEREQLEQAIAAMEAQRALLGDAAANAAIAGLRQKLAEMEAPPAPPPPARETRVGEQQRKQITVLLADVSGFTAMSETMDAEDVSDTMNALWSRLDETIEDHGGYIDKHIGDAVMALFGAPTAHEDDPERAIRAALAMQGKLRAWNEQGRPPLKMRIGVNTGPVLLGEVGTKSEYTAMGDTVNLTSRLESAAPLGGILISHACYRHVRGIFNVEALEPIRVKGKTEVVQVYSVGGIKPRAFRVPTRGVEGIETRMVGRDAELEGLQKALRQVIENQEARAVSVVAEAGVGKSRLLYEFENWAEVLPGMLLSFKGRASPAAASVPYFTIRDMFAFRFEIKNSDSAAVAREKLEQGIVQCMGQEGVEKAHFIGHLIGLDFSESPYLRGILDDARQIHDRAFHYIAQFFTAVTGCSPSQSPAENSRTPAVLMLDDLHWADEGTLDLIQRLAYDCRDSPLLIAGLTRPILFERRPSWGEELPHHMRLALHPLSRQDSRLLVQEILRQVDQLPADLRDLIVERAEGNPFYTEELIKMLIEDGVIVKGAERWRVELGRLVGIRVPATLTGVLQARLDGLPVPEREALQRASVVGRVFWNGVVHRIARSDDGDQLDQEHTWLESLCQRELVFERKPSAFAGEQEYNFKHSLLHDVAYESVLMRQRRVYHAKVAEWLIENSGERVTEYAGQIGQHLELSGKEIEAAEWYGRAGKQAQDTYAPEAATEHYEKALELLPDSTEPGKDPYVAQRIEWYGAMGLMLLWQTQFDGAAEAYHAMRALAESAGDAVAQVHAWEGLSWVQRAQGDYREMLESAEKAEAVARGVGVSARKALARVLCTKGHALNHLGEAEQALALGEQALALSSQEAAQRVMVDSLQLLVWTHRALGHYEQATHYLERALALSRDLGDRVGVARMLNDLGRIALSLEDYQSAAAHFEDALTIARELGQRFGELFVLSNLGEAQVGLKAYQKAEANLHQVIEMAEAVGWGDLSENYRILAEACLGQKKMAEAVSAAQKALELGQETEEKEMIGTAWRTLGMVLAVPEDPHSITIGEETVNARACFGRSREIFEETGMEGEQARTLRAWAQYELERGDKERGQRLAREAEEIFGRLGL